MIIGTTIFVFIDGSSDELFMKHKGKDYLITPDHYLGGMTPDDFVVASGNYSDKSQKFDSDTVIAYWDEDGELWRTLSVANSFHVGRTFIKYVSNTI